MRFMKTVNSISGGKTSAYIAKHYPADINIFSLVRIEDKECLWMEGKDEKTRQIISDRIGTNYSFLVENVHHLQNLFFEIAKQELKLKKENGL